MKICTYCNASNTDAATSCEKCGSRELENKCYNCATAFKGDNCPNCGVKAGERGRKCEKCNITVFTATCTNCGAVIFPELVEQEEAAAKKRANKQNNVFKRIGDCIRYGEYIPKSLRGGPFKYALLTWLFLPFIVAFCSFKTFWFASIPLIPFVIFFYVTAQKLWNERKIKVYLFPILTLLIGGSLSLGIWALIKFVLFSGTLQ